LKKQKHARGGYTLGNLDYLRFEPKKLKFQEWGLAIRNFQSQMIGKCPIHSGPESYVLKGFVEKTKHF
jgi:hypothetical protein